jgi:tetratricopeptide (TPR) repeat protein
MPRPRIFISYARSSAASVESIVALRPALEDAGFGTLQDVEIELGADWEPTLKRWLGDCHGAVVFLSPEALTSDWVAREVAILLERRKTAGTTHIRIVPTAVGGLGWNDLQRQLTSHLLGPLAAIQGGTNLPPDQIIAALRGLHDFVGLPVGLDRGHTNAPPTTMNVLRASQQTIPFRHREREIETLEQWTRLDVRNSIQLLYGPGGIGKTRLALEMVRRKNEAGWDAGFLKKDVQEVAVLVQGSDPLLVVVDYAETKPRQARDLLRHVARYDKSDARPFIRVLLLARTLGDWWDHLTAQHSETELLVDRSPSPQRLEPLPQTDRTAGWQEAVARFAQVLGRPVPAAHPRWSGESSDVLGIPLYLHMAALDHVLAPASALPWQSAGDLLDRIVTHESRYWKDWLQARGYANDEIAHNAVERTIGAVALLDGAESPAAVRPVVEGRDGRYEWRREYWNVLSHLYPDGRGGVRALEPDLLCEHIVDRLMERTGGDILPAIMDAGERAATTALIVLTRLASRVDDARWLRLALGGRLNTLAEPAMTVAAMQGEPLAQTLHLLFMEDQDPTLADRLDQLLLPPGRRQVLRQLAASVARRRLQQAPTDSSSESLAMRAHRQIDLALRLSDTGEIDEAGEVIWEATVSFAELVNREGEQFAAALATALGVQADILGRHGRVKASIESGRSVIALMQLLKPEHKKGIEPYIAARYNNLSNAYAKVGRHKEAAEAAKVAVEYYRHLALEGRSLPEAALAFGNLGRHLVRAGSGEDGVTWLRVATTIFRELAARDPEGFERELAFYLDELGQALRAQDAVDEALHAFEESVKAWRAVRRRDPSALAIELAAALLELGQLTAATRGDRMAIEPGREALSLLGGAVAGGQSSARPELARARHEVGRWLGGAGEHEAAVASLQEAIAMRSALHAEGIVGVDKVALSYGGLGGVYLQAGDPGNAAAAFAKGLRVILDRPGPHDEAMRPLLRQLGGSYMAATEAARNGLDEPLLQRLIRELTEEASADGPPVI